MNVVLIAIGCVLMALGLVMAANRSGYVYFVVGPRSVLILAGVVGDARLLDSWGGSQIGRLASARRESHRASGPVKPAHSMLYIWRRTERARLLET